MVATSLLASGCATGHPPAVSKRALEEAQTFPYYTTYWVGPHFAGQPVTAVDGTTGYSSSIGDSVYYGDCVGGKTFLGGSCRLPLQVTTVIYHLHSNQTLGTQSNTVIRGVPATIYDSGRSLELYTGRVAIDIFSNTLIHALQATSALRPFNAPGSANGPLPPPVYCPGLSGAQDANVQAVMAHLPSQVCQRKEAALALKLRLAVP